MAFDFFNISGSLFVETQTDTKIRSSAQGLFMMMTNGFGAVLGSLSSGWIIDTFFTHKFTQAQDLSAHLDTTVDNPAFLTFLSNQKISLTNNLLSQSVELRDWHNIWLTFAAYALVIAVLFALFFKHKHNPEDVKTIKH
jgi:NHS family xanthosine MFS transporter